MCGCSPRKEFDQDGLVGEIDGQTIPRRIEEDEIGTRREMSGGAGRLSELEMAKEDCSI